jgi:hypothetical protein
MEERMWELPIVRALLVCERIEIDPFTQRLSFHNRVTRWRVARFPSDGTYWKVFAALSNGFGTVPINLIVRHLETDLAIPLQETTVDFSDRLREVPLLLHVRNLSFPESGTYEFALYAGDELLAVHVMRVAGPRRGE